MSDTISTQGNASQMPQDSQFGGQNGVPAYSNGSTNQDGAFASVGDGSLQSLPPDPFTNPAAYGRPVPGQRLSDTIPQGFPGQTQGQQSFQQEGVPAQGAEPPFDVDERFAHLPKEEQIARSWQSRHDKLASENKTMTTELQRLQRYEQFLAEVMEDDQVFESFVAERKPEMVKQKDVSGMIQSALKKEFGEDFTPDDQQVRIPGTKDWLYAKKAEELYVKMSQSGQDRVLPLKELRELKARERQAQQQMAEREIQQIKEQMRWDDTQLKGFTQWAEGVKAVDLAKMYVSIMTSAQYRAPFATNHQGSPVAPNSALQRLDRLFGQ